MSKKAKPTVTTAEPWKQITPYLLGDSDKNITGVFPQAQKLFGQGGFTPEMQGLADSYGQTLAGRQFDPRFAGLESDAGAIGQGAMDIVRGAVPVLMFFG